MSSTEIFLQYLEYKAACHRFNAQSMCPITPSTFDHWRAVLFCKRYYA